MKSVLNSSTIVILVFVLVAFTKPCLSQVIQINTNVTDNLLKVIEIGNQTIVTNFQNYIIRSGDEFNTHSILPLPSTVLSGRKKLKYQNNKLYLLAGSLSPTYFEFWVSIDTGNSWTLLFDTTSIHVYDFTMFDSLNGVIYTSQNMKLRTSDGGQSWNSESSLINTPAAIFMYNDSIGVLPTQNKILLSNNRFVNEVFQSNSEMSGVTDGQYLNKDTLIFSSCVNVSGCYLLCSHNGGTLWQTKVITEFEPSGLHFFNYNEGYVVGWGYILGVAPLQGVIRKTTDMGATWTTYLTGIDYKLNDIHFLNDSIALITGEQGVLLKWNKHSTATTVIEIPNENGISLYPNPSTSEHILKIASTSKYNQELTVKMYDIFGRKVSEHRVLKNSNTGYELRNDIINLSKGVYLYKWRMNDREYFVKFVKE